MKMLEKFLLKNYFILTVEIIFNINTSIRASASRFDAVSVSFHRASASRLDVVSVLSRRYETTSRQRCHAHLVSTRRDISSRDASGRGRPRAGETTRTATWRALSDGVNVINLFFLKKIKNSKKKFVNFNF